MRTEKKLLARKHRTLVAGKRRVHFGTLAPQDTMRQLLATRYVEIPSDVKLTLNGRIVTVSGKRGELKRDFRHVSLDMRKVEKGKQLRVDLWFGNRKQLACVRTVCSLIENMITGVRIGFTYKMRFVYAHFPINVTFENNTVEIRNFLGEKRVRRVTLSPGVEYVRSADVKDQIELSGIDLAKVSQDCANITQACLVKRKDIRKFLDGIYVSEKGHIESPQ
jgi:large subunit ribosomal protein L9e